MIKGNLLDVNFVDKCLNKKKTNLCLHLILAERQEVLISFTGVCL